MPSEAFVDKKHKKWRAVFKAPLNSMKMRRLIQPRPATSDCDRSSEEHWEHQRLTMPTLMARPAVMSKDHATDRPLGDGASNGCHLHSGCGEQPRVLQHLEPLVGWAVKARPARKELMKTAMATHNESTHGMRRQGQQQQIPLGRCEYAE